MMFYDTFTYRYFKMDYLEFMNEMSKLCSKENCTYGDFCEVVGLRKITHLNDVQIAAIKPKISWFDWDTKQFITDIVIEV